MFRLALELGHADPYKMAEDMPSSLLTEWAAFFNLEPFGSDVEAWRVGLACSVVANCNRNPKTKPNPYKPTDFIPKKTKKQTPEEMMDIFQGAIDGASPKPSS